MSRPGVAPPPDFLLSEIINVEVNSDHSSQSEVGFCIRHPQISYFM